MKNALHTSAQPAQSGTLLEFSGTVTHARVCMAQVGEPAMVLPVLEVLCLAEGNRVKARKVYTLDTQHLAEAQAQRMPPGTVIHMTHYAHGITLSLPLVHDIHIIPSDAS